MKSHWREYLTLGINHHLLYPASFNSTVIHRNSLPTVLRFPQFEAVDMFIPDGEIEDAETAMVRDSGKQVIYNCPLMNSNERNPHSPDSAVRQSTLHDITRHIERAAKLGARKVVVASGPDPGMEKREEQTEYFIEYLCALCSIASPEMDILIEPFDRSIGKNLMIGPSTEGASVVEQVRTRGSQNIGILVDMGHVPLMEETFSHAIQTAAPYIKHVHLGSCVMKNSADPLYGDMHPPWGYEGGENDVPELIDFLRCLFQFGYLAEGKRPTVTLEMRPYPELDETQSVERWIEKLDEAWRQLPEPQEMITQ